MFNSLNTLKVDLNDVFDSLRPFYILGHIIGLGYHQVLKSTNGRKRYKVVALYMLRYILHILLFVWIWYYFIEQDQPGLTTSNLAGTLAFHGNTAIKCLALANMLIGGLFVNKITYIINTVDKLDEDIERWDVEIRHW